MQVDVRDFEGQGKAWSTFLGREIDELAEERGSGRRRARFLLERGSVSLFEARVEAQKEGLSRLAFACDDISAAGALLGRSGLNCGAVNETVWSTSGGEAREFRCRVSGDPRRGDFVDLIERPIRRPSRAAAEAAAHWLDHVVVQTGEADEAKRFYGEGLGLRLPLDRAFPQWGSRMLFFRTAGVTVEVTMNLEEEHEGPDRLFGLAYRVGDAAAARRRLADAGFPVSELRPGRKAGNQVFHSQGAPTGIPTLVLGREGSNILSS